MQTAIATVCLSGTLNEKLEAIAAARFKGVEIFENDLLSFDGTPAEVGRRIEDLGLEAVTFQPFRDFEGMPEPQRAKAFSRAERKFDLMAELGCDLLLVCSNVVARVARRHRSRRRRLPRARRARGQARLARRLRGARLGAAHQRLPRCLGGGATRRPPRDRSRARHLPHPRARHRSRARSRAIPKDRIFLVQVADAPLLDMDYLSWSRHYRCFPGQGDLAIGAFMDGAAGDRLRRAALARDLQRPVSAPAPRAASRSTGSARSSFMLDELRRAPPGRRPACRRCRRGRAAAASSSIEFAMDETAAATFETALRRARLRRRRRCTGRRR